jgi:peptidoglycan/LPS O-acetylase OafA/YrhL
VRAIAALAVIVTHVSFATDSSGAAWWARYAARLDVGVAIFFAVAGFLLYRPYVAQRIDGAPAPSLTRYGFKRALRILPAYWIAFAALGALGLITLDSKFWEHITLVQIYDRDQVLGGIAPAWSLAVEATFYLALPLFVLVMRSIHGATTRAARLRGEWALIGLLVAVAIAFRIVLHATTGPSVWAATLVGHLDWFAAGMALAVTSVALAGDIWPSPRPAPIELVERLPWLPWAGAVACLYVAATAMGDRGTWGVPASLAGQLAEHALYALIALFVLAPAVFPGEGRGAVHELLRHRVTAWLGLISYGLFLYNLPIANWLATESRVSDLLGGRPMLAILIGTLVLSIAAATASHYLLERPLLALKDWRPQRHKRSAGTAAPAAAAPRSAG